VLAGAKPITHSFSGRGRNRADPGGPSLRIKFARPSGPQFCKDTDLTIKAFSELGFAEPIERALAARGHAMPTPIQAQAIPDLIKGRDLMGIAQTGTGKTGAFSLPLLHRLSASGAARARPKAPRALILAPTRELAIQIGEEIRAYARHLPLRQTLIYGGVGQGPQVRDLSRGVDIVIATPGRLLDLMTQGHIALDAVETLVLDEADRMLDMGFVRDIRKIAAKLPKRRQTLMFCATMPAEIGRLASELLHEPVRVEVAPQSTPIDRIDQRLYHVESAGKTALLSRILEDPALSRVIVFARTKHRANRVADTLSRRGVTAEAIHGNKSQSARQRALSRFRDGKARVLVATDIAARGIDVDRVSHVINFELPNEPESYVHRIGRTARAGAEGIALSFCDPSERKYLRDIEKLIRGRLSVIGESPASAAPSRPAADTAEERAPGAKRGRRRGGQRGRRRDGGQRAVLRAGA